MTGHSAISDRLDRVNELGFVGRAGLLGLVAALGLLTALRILAFGWSGIAPDDARYLYVGLSLLDGHGAITADGAVFLLRSPVYSVVLGFGARLTPNDPVGGAHLAALAVALGGFATAVVLGWRLGGQRAGAATAVAIAATPLLWALVPTLRIDLAQAAGVVAILLVIGRPTPARWLLAGLLLGLTVLVKESALPLLLLPGAFLGTMGGRRLAALGGLYVTGAVVAAGWWWVVVWREAGAIFPANALAVIERRQVGTDLSVGIVGAILLPIMLIGWLRVAALARREPAVRPLLLAALLLTPPALYATANGLDARNYTTLAVLSAVAVGVAVTNLPRLPAVTSQMAGRSLATALVVLATLAVVAGQIAAPVASRPPLPDLVATWLRSHTEPGDRIAMTFRYRAVVALLLYGRNEVAELRPRRVGPTDDPSWFVWMGLRDRQLFGYTRAQWTKILAEPGTRALAIVTPHELAPADLLPVLERGLPAAGIEPVGTLRPGGPEAALFAVHQAELPVDIAALPFVLQPDAALAWLDLDEGNSSALARFVAARPIVVGDAAAVAPLLERLGSEACSVPAADLGPDQPAIRIELGGSAACP